jgi:hypothetical protein
MAINDLSVRDSGGITIFAKETFDSGAYVEWNVRDASGIADAILVGLTIRNNTISDQDETTADAIARVGLTAAPDDGDTWDVFPDKDSVYVRFDPLKRKTSVWVKNVAGAVTLNFAAEYDVR